MTTNDQSAHSKGPPQAPINGVVLASGSPRRKLLLPLVRRILGTVTPDTDEARHAGESAHTLAVRLAAAKAQRAAALASDMPVGAKLVAADTVVSLGGAPLGKPGNPNEARRMLLSLSGQVHTVITALGVTLAGRSGELAVNVGWVTTAVHMRELDAAEIEQSIARGEPFDKAGGYAIQDPELRPVRAIQGCFPNVVGLPLCAVQKMLDDPSSSGSLSPAIAPCELCRMAATELARHGYGSPDMI